MEELMKTFKSFARYKLKVELATKNIQAISSGQENYTNFLVTYHTILINSSSATQCYNVRLGRNKNPDVNRTNHGNTVVIGDEIIYASNSSSENLFSG